MPSERQKNQLRASRIQSDLEIRRNPNGTYEGRDPETGLSIIRTSDGAIVPAYLTGNAQPLLGEPTLSVQTDGVNLALGRSAPVVDEVFVPFVEIRDRVAILFVKNGIRVPSEDVIHRTQHQHNFNIFDPVESTVIFGDEAGDLPTGFQNITSGLPEWSGVVGSTTGLIGGVLASSRLTKLTNDPPGTSDFSVQVIFDLDRTILKGTIEWTVDVLETPGGATQADGRCGIYYDSNEASLPVFGATSPLLTDEQTWDINDIPVTFNVTTNFDFSSTTLTSSNRVLSVWAGMRVTSFVSDTNLLMRISISSIDWDHSLGELWLGGDRPTPVKLRDLALGSLMASGGQNAYMTSTNDEIYVWFQEWRSPTDSNGSYYTIETGSNNFTQTDYMVGDTVIPSVDDWRSPLATMEVKPSLVPDFGSISDSCVAFYIQPTIPSSNENIIDSTLLTLWSPGQLIDGILAQTRLENGESISNSISERIQIDGGGASCSETPLDDVTIPIVYSLGTALEEPSPIFYSAYFV